MVKCKLVSSFCQVGFHFGIFRWQLRFWESHICSHNTKHDQFRTQRVSNGPLVPQSYWRVNKFQSPKIEKETISNEIEDGPKKPAIWTSLTGNFLTASQKRKQRITKWESVWNVSSPFFWKRKKERIILTMHRFILTKRHEQIHNCSINFVLAHFGRNWGKVWCQRWQTHVRVSSSLSLHPGAESNEQPHKMRVCLLYVTSSPSWPRHFLLKSFDWVMVFTWRISGECCSGQGPGA